MAYMTRLVTITNYENITDELRPFVEFQAAQKKVKLVPRTLLAILQVENIPSYHIVFLDSKIGLDDVLKELKAQELELNEETKRTLAMRLSERSKRK